jgi:hypothetical protein
MLIMTHPPIFKIKTTSLFTIVYKAHIIVHIKESTVMQDSTNTPKSNKKAYFVRVPSELYEIIQKIAEDQGRTIQMQTQIMLGAAVNRNLVNPTAVEATFTSDDNQPKK